MQRALMFPFITEIIEHTYCIMMNPTITVIRIDESKIVFKYIKIHPK